MRITVNLSSKFHPIVFFLCILSLTAQQTIAQQNNNLERLLESVDNPNAWSSTPPPGNAFTAQPSVMPSQTIPSIPLPIQQSSYPINTLPNNFGLQPNNSAIIQQQLLRLFSGNGTNNNVKNGQQNWSSSTAYSDWQEAENQAAKAHDAEERARYEKNKGYSEDDASEAYYAANAARDASDRVYYASQKGDPTAKQYAGRARAAADRAREDADQARYFADTKN